MKKAIIGILKHALGNASMSIALFAPYRNV
jgi:hypothetical protein